MRFLFILSSFLFLMASCQHKPTDYQGQYPDNVSNIIVNRCATAGCHNAESYEYASNLRLDTWAELFKGGSSGAVIIPYDKDNSSLCYFINTDSNLGPVLRPTMPVNQRALSASEYMTITNWIQNGAPDKTGKIPFEDNPDTRQKIYITQQGCDMMAVVDAKTKVIMRNIKLGKLPTIEVPHSLKFSPDGKYCYVIFTQGPYMQKIDATKDAVIADLYLGQGAWNMLFVSDDGKSMMVTDYSNINAKIKLIDCEKMQEIATYEDFVNPHGIAANAAFDTFYVTSQFGNMIYRLTKKGNVKQISIDDNEPNTISNTLDPHEIIMSPDKSKYFLTCMSSNEVRVMDTKTNKLLKVIPVGKTPLEFAMSRKKPYLFVTCENDINNTYPGYIGSVYVINYETLELIKKIEGPFYEVHGITVDDYNDWVCVVSRNIASNGPLPHHTSECGGRNGYYSVIDLNTLEIVSKKKYETTVDPYSADTRFKSF